MVEKLPTSFFMYAIIQTLSPCFASTSFICKAIEFPKDSIVSKKPTVT
jgi:hypothetical protein